jgi:hypothetical protein
MQNIAIFHWFKLRYWRWLFHQQSFFNKLLYDCDSPILDPILIHQTIRLWITSIGWPIQGLIIWKFLCSKNLFENSRLIRDFKWNKFFTRAFNVRKYLLIRISVYLRLLNTHGDEICKDWITFVISTDEKKFYWRRGPNYYDPVITCSRFNA